MLVALQQKTISKMMAKYNIKSWDNEIVSVLNNALYKFVQKELSKGEKKQNGGRIVMPLEYYGVDSKNFVETSAGQSVEPTVDYIRPPLEVQMVGGTQKLQVTMSAIQTVMEEISSKQNKTIEKKTQVAKALKSKFEEVMESVLSKASKKAKEGHMSGSELKEVLQMKKYSKLQ